MKKIYSILYVAHNEAFKIGPFGSEKAVWKWLNDGEKRKAEFDITSQLVYILTPDHRMIEVSASDLKSKCDKCGSLLNRKGYCKDVTCPYSDHLQCENFSVG